MFIRIKPMHLLTLAVDIVVAKLAFDVLTGTIKDASEIADEIVITENEAKRKGCIL